MQRKGVNVTEEHLIKSMIAAGKTWPQIKVHLTHVDEEYVKEHLFDPLEAEFKKNKKFASGIVQPSAHEAAAIGAVAEAKKYAGARGELDKKAEALAERERKLAEKEKELEEKAKGLDDLVGKKGK